MGRRLVAILAIILILSISAIASSISYAGVNDLTITNFDADYYLQKDKAGHSDLKVIERITAQFPEINQNHGIERAIPNTYDGHTTDLKIDSITDDLGRNWQYTTSQSNNNTVLRIGSADTYVHGIKTYELTYHQRDVTKYFSDRNVDEFYWDTNGTDWRVPIEKLTARVHVPGNITSTLNGESACYIGQRNATERCDMTESAEGTGKLFTAISARTLKVGDNVTFAVGFTPHTFATYQPSIGNILTSVRHVVNTVGAPFIVFGLSFFLMYLFKRVTNRTKELGTIVPEYVPPLDTSVTVAAQIEGNSNATMTAQLLDLAVRHYLRIYEIKPKTWFSPAQYDIEIVKDLSDLKWEEQEIMRDMFNGQVTPGSKLDLKTLRNNFRFTKRTLNNDNDLRKLVNGDYGYREKRPKQVQLFRRLALILTIIGLLLLSLPTLFVALLAFILSFTVWSLTDKGLALRRYLKGLKLYIKVAETDRIKMLQSPDGVEKVATLVNGLEPAQLVKLYERVLPYAVLFGQEKQWSAQLGAYYETTNTSPGWYNSRSGIFNAVVFSSAISSFSTTTTTYASSSNSSSSGAGGGGSSGGGGGGGGGGGW